MSSVSVEQLIAAAARRFSLPGGVVALVDGDETALYPFGTTRLGGSGNVDAATTFSIASCSKAFTACAVALLVDAGGLAWDDPVRTHLPEFELHDPWISAHITLRDLLGMRTGLGRAGICEWGSNPSLALPEIFRRLRHTQPVSGFRERYGYTNVAYSALSEIVGRAAGTDFAGFVRDGIFVPLGMPNAFLSEGTPARTVNCAFPHTRIDEVVASLPAPRCGGRLGESCGYLSGADAAAWMRFLLEAQAPPRLLRQPVFAEMFLPQSLGTAEPRLGRAFQNYCMGWEACDYFGDPVFCHEGGEFGASSRTMLDRARRLGIAVYLNISSPAVRALSLEIYDHCRGRPHRDWSGELPGWMASEAETRVAEAQRAYAFDAGTSAPFAADAFEGAFSSPVNGMLRLTRSERGYDAVFEDSSVLDGAFEHLGGAVYRLAPAYAGMQDNLKGRVRVRLAGAGDARRIDVMGVGVFDAVS
ncbi:MAG TPA: serine hydrolase domain-containing protein [Rhizomicrobium sp.]